MNILKKFKEKQTSSKSDKIINGRIDGLPFQDDDEWVNDGIDGLPFQGETEKYDSPQKQKTKKRGEKLWDFFRA